MDSQAPDIQLKDLPRYINPRPTMPADGYRVDDDGSVWRVIFPKNTRICRVTDASAAEIKKAIELWVGGNDGRL